jgi:site-specific DNA-methyltransferase (adenine-specific)
MRLYYKDEYCTLLQGDCLEGMQKMIDKGLKFDAIITDPPYGTTACKWDSVIPFNKMWECLNEIIKDNGAICLFGSQPFTSELIHSNLKLFRYSWIWKKSKCGNFQLAKYQPLKYTEDIVVFSKKPHNYYPILRDAPEATIKRRQYSYDGSKDVGGIKHMASQEYKQYFMNGKDKINPCNIIEFKNVINNIHPTQKPVELMEYLINTYTNEGNIVLDFTCGSGTTLLACKNLKRYCYGIEKEEQYCEITKNRLLKTR